MKQRNQAGVGVHCRQSQVITEYMENTLPTDVDIRSIDRLVIFFAFVDYVYCIFGGHLIYLKLCGCLCVQPTVDYIGVPRTVGFVWVFRRFDLLPF